MKIKKLQSGGIPQLYSTFMPLTVTDPYAGADPTMAWIQQAAGLVTGMGGSSSKSSSESGGSSGMPTMKDTLALLKDMKGLDTDMSAAIAALQQSAQEAAILGDSSSLISSYYHNLNIANKVNQSKQAYDKAYELVKANGGLQEAAITSDGNVIVKDNNTLKAVSPAEYLKNKDKYQLQTNGSLLYARAHDRNMAFNDSVLEIVYNGTSMDKIFNVINAIASQLGTSSNSIEGYTAKEAQQIQNGIAILKEAGSKEGATNITENSQKNQARLAIEAIYVSLHENQKTLLKLKSNGSDEGAKQLIASIVMNRVSDTNKIEYKDPKSSTSSDGSSSGGSDIDKQVKTNPAMQFFFGYGSRSVLSIQNKTQHAIEFNAVHMPIMKGNEPIPIGSLRQLGNSDFGPMLNITQATMGGVRISPGAIDNVIFEGGQIYSAELPIDKNSKILKPDTKFLEEIDNANNELIQMGINPNGGNTLSNQDIQTINAVYEKHKLPVKYQANGELTSRYARFAMVNATAMEDAFEGDVNFDSGAVKVTDSKERKNFENNMRFAGNEKFSLNNGIASWIGLDGDDLYKGVVFIPMYNNIWNAMATSDSKVSPAVSRQIETEQQRTDFRINSGYKAPDPWTNNQ